MSRASKRIALNKLRSYIYSLLIALIFSLALWTYLSQPSAKSIQDPASTTAALYANQINDDLTHAFVSGIASAKQSVLLIVYTLTDPAIINALKKKGEEGINVRVITDAKESPWVTSKLGPSVSMIRRFSEGRMHQKILVIDGKISWIGSANMTSESLRMHGNLVSVINSAPLSDRLQAKALSMIERGNKASFAPEEFIIGGQLIELWFLPDDRQAAQRIKKVIDSAKKNIRIAMFTWTRMDFARAVVNAAERGVNVEAVLDSNQGKGASAKIVAFLKNSKVKISLSRGGPLLHHKFLYVDEEILVNGSANWTRDAFDKNDECFIVMHNLELTQQNQMESLWKVISKESIPVKKDISL